MPYTKRTTRCPECGGLTQAVREGVRCDACRRHAELNRKRTRKPRPPSENGIVILHRQAMSEMIRDEAARHGVPKVVMRARLRRGS